MTVSLLEKWSEPSPRSRAMALTLAIVCVYDTRWVKWASNDRFLLLARQVLYIARGHDRLWLRLIKLQGNGGSDVTSHDVSVK